MCVFVCVCVCVCVHIWCISTESDLGTALPPCGANSSLPPKGHDGADPGESDRQEEGGRDAAGEWRGHRLARQECKTALMSATHACHREVVEVLLGKIGSIDLHTKNG